MGANHSRSVTTVPSEAKVSDAEFGPGRRPPGETCPGQGRAWAASADAAARSPDTTAPSMLATHGCFV